MELKGKTFDINGDKKKIVNTDDTFAYFADGARVKKDILVTKYEEVMDPDSFFNSTEGLQGLANDFEKIDTNAINERATPAPTPNVHDVSPTTTTIINEPVVDEPPVQKIDNTGLKPVANQGGGDFFSKIKRNNTIDIDFKITEQFPDLDFVRMMNDNYETSIIEHFAREIVEKMIYDPEKLLESIKNSITEIVYGKGSVQLKENKQETPFSEELSPEVNNSDMIEKITEDSKVIEVEDEDEGVIEETVVETVEEATEEIATNVNEQPKEEKIEENEQKADKETEGTDKQPELEPEA